VVEDEPDLLVLMKQMLETYGYSVLASSTPRDAIRIAQESSGDIKLLITDLVMPEMTGRDLVEHLTPRCPWLKYLFMSGYSDDVIAGHGGLEEGVYFIGKPFSMQDLAAKVREVIKSFPT
jgi:DNA-binding response OmpR family regulator